MTRRKSESKSKKRKMYLLQCQFCHKIFEWPDKRKKYCPGKCQHDAKKAREKKKQEIRDAEMRRRTKAYLARNPEYLPKLKALIKKNKKIYPNSSFDLAFRMMRALGNHLGNNFIKHVERELNELTL